MHKFRHFVKQLFKHEHAAPPSVVISTRRAARSTGKWPKTNHTRHSPIAVTIYFAETSLYVQNYDALQRNYERKRDEAKKLHKKIKQQAAW